MKGLNEQVKKAYYHTGDVAEILDVSMTTARQLMISWKMRGHAFQMGKHGMYFIGVNSFNKLMTEMEGK